VRSVYKQLRHCCPHLHRMPTLWECLSRYLRLALHSQHISKQIGKNNYNIILPGYWYSYCHDGYNRWNDEEHCVDFNFTCRSNNGGLSLTSVISTVKEQTPSSEGSPWSVAFTVTDTNFPSSPSLSKTYYNEKTKFNISYIKLFYFIWNKINI
jgi:hypothetical protein